MKTQATYTFKEKALLVFHETNLTLISAILSDLSLRYLISLLNAPLKSGNASVGTTRTVSCDNYRLVMDLIESVLIMPVIEEVIFRLVPLVFMRLVLKQKKSLILNVISSAVFAFCHNFTWNISNILASRYHSGWIPLPQFICGLFLWHIARKYGVIWAIASHGAINLVLTLVKASNC
jgi:hypothetical protein